MVEKHTTRECGDTWIEELKGKYVIDVRSGQGKDEEARNLLTLEPLRRMEKNFSAEDIEITAFGIFKWAR